MKKIFKNCFSCIHLEWVSGDIGDPEGYTCNQRNYRTIKEAHKMRSEVEKELSDAKQLIAKLVVVVEYYDRNSDEEEFEEFCEYLSGMFVTRKKARQCLADNKNEILRFSNG